MATKTIGELKANLDDARILCRGGFKGKKVHIAYKGSSTLSCGHWLRVQAGNFEIQSADDVEVDTKNLCSKCFGENQR